MPRQHTPLPPLRLITVRPRHGAIVYADGDHRPLSAGVWSQVPISAHIMLAIKHGDLEQQHVEPQPSVSPTPRLIPNKAPVPEIERDPRAFNYLLEQLRLNRRYARIVAWEHCRDNFQTPHREFCIVWRHARVAAGLSERARPPTRGRKKPTRVT